MPEGLKAVDSALDRVASRMTHVIRNRALEVGWPAEVAAQISMVRTANGIGIHVEEGAEDAVFDLEFGSSGNAPLSALSTLDSPRTKQFQKKVAHDSMDELLDQVRRLFS